MTKEEIQDYVFNFLSMKGLPLITVCAIMGNITGENSSWGITVEESNGVGLGLCQWSFSRRTQLEAYGIDLQSQCEFLWSELTGENTDITGASMQWISDPVDSVDNGEGFSCSLTEFRSGSGSIERLTKAFCYCWERPAYETNHLESIRIPAAREFYKRYAGVDPEDPDNPIIQYRMRKKGFNFVLFNQRNRRLKRNG